MIISHRHKFIFLKTRKTASTSIEAALIPLCGPDDIISPTSREVTKARGHEGQNFRRSDAPPRSLWRRIMRRPERHYHRSVGFYEHIPAAEIRRYVGDEVWNSYYKFAFERNPWDRQVSLYRFKDKNRPCARSFERFLARRKRAYVPNFRIYTIDGLIALNYVGRFETLDADFRKILMDVGIKGPVALPELNASSHARGEYQSYFTKRTRKKIARWYAQEIWHFGYEFGSNGARPNGS